MAMGVPGLRFAPRLDAGEVEERTVQQVRGRDVRERAENGFEPSGMVPFPFAQQRLHLLSLQLVLRAAQVAGNDREGAQLCIRLEVALLHIRERADHDVPSVVGEQLGRHGLQRAAVEEVEEERLEDVAAMVAEGDLRRAELVRHAVEHAPAQPRAQAAHRLSLGDHALHDAVGVLHLDVERHAQRVQVVGQHVLRKSRMPLVEVHRDDLERDRRLGAQPQQDVEQRVAVLAAREAHHHLVARLDHAEVGDRLPHLAAQALGELRRLEFGLARILGDRPRF
jgi:hypothetical protein